jgi:hypothetical protein
MQREQPSFTNRVTNGETMAIDWRKDWQIASSFFAKVDE